MPSSRKINAERRALMKKEIQVSFYCYLYCIMRKNKAWGGEFLKFNLHIFLNLCV